MTEANAADNQKYKMSSMVNLFSENEKNNINGAIHPKDLMKTMNEAESCLFNAIRILDISSDICSKNINATNINTL
ncbi:hypothetical protein AB4393_17260 [Vibrio splendidus]|uniref:hypothetical protein n=1 Tax=Vibrio splendidus TaxID=29497 RepID=UPI0010557EF0|nr:hypothetical protein [Vibrio splendidus]